MACHRFLRSSAAALVLFFAGGALWANPVIVQGTILSPGGSPLFHAHVELLPLPSHFETRQSILGGRFPPLPIASSTTGLDGRYSLQAPAGRLGKVVVRAGGFVPVEYSPIPLVAALELPPVTMVQDVGAAFEFRDSTGIPLEETRVFATSATRSAWSEVVATGWRAGFRYGVTDKEGRASLRRIRNELLDVTLYPPGQAPARILGVEGGNLLLSEHGWRRPIEVRRASGEPIAGVLACVGADGWPIGVTDPQGQIQVAGGNAKLVDVQLFLEDGRRYREKRLEASNKPVVFRVGEPVRILGRVSSSPAGKSLAGALVWRADDPGRFLNTGSKGEYELLARRDARFWIQAEAAGFAPERASVDETNAVSGQGPLLTLHAGVVLSGQVIDTKGAPVSAVRIEANPRGSSLQAGSESRALTDANGAFQIAQLRADTVYHLTAAKSAFFTTTMNIERPETAATLVKQRIVLHRSRPIYGRVVDVQERPIAGVQVGLQDPKTTEGGPLGATPSLKQAAALRSAETDEAGYFRLAEPTAIKVHVIAKKKDFAPTAKVYSIPGGDGPFDLGVLVLKPGVTLSGRVINTSGAPIAGVAVWAAQAAFGWPRTTLEHEGEQPDALSGADGHFVLDDLPGGQVLDLVFQKKGYLPASLLSVAAPNPHVLRIVLTLALPVAGRVLEEDGRPIARAQVSLRPEELPPAEVPILTVENERSATSDDKGRFTLENVAPGKYDASAFAEGFQPAATQAIELSQDEDVPPLEFVLSRGEVLRGLVATSEDGKPMPGVLVAVGERPSGVSGEDGVYELLGVPLGLQSVMARHPALGRIVRETQIEPGVNTLDLFFEDGTSATGRVVDNVGTPMGGVTVSLSGAAETGRELKATTRADGVFHFARVIDGVYDILAEKSGYMSTTLPAAVRVDGRPVRGLEVVLEDAAAMVTGQINPLSIEEIGKVVVAARRGGHEQEGSVDDNGRYEISDLGFGEWVITATLPGGSRQAHATVDIQSGTRHITRDLDFGGGLTLRGQVVHEGAPLGGSTVSIVGRDNPTDRDISTDYTGHFVAEGLEPGNYKLGVTNFPERIVHNEELALTQDREILIQIATMRVGGHVLSAAGSESVTDALVSLFQLLGPNASTPASVFTMATDGAGGFSFPRIPEGSYRLVVSKEGYTTVDQLLDVRIGTELSDLRVSVSSAEDQGAPKRR